MAPRRKIRQREAQLAFEALTIEGGLLSPDWLSRIAQLAAGSQSELDYRVPKGLNLRDEIGRYWRIAQAHWSDFAAGKGGGADKRVVAERFVKALLGESFGFTSLAPVSEPQVVEGRRYPVGFFALGKRVPVVIAPAGAGMDEPAAEFGDEGRRRTAFGLCQEYLNAEPACVWALVSDGVMLRILRDNASLTRPAWVEASLERIFTEERYADFAALWLLVHESRFGRADQAATDCALEAWRTAGREEGTRAREHLRQGVEEALTALGGGFLAHPDNQALRAALNDGTLTTKDYFNQLLRLVYRLIFVITAEERGVLHPDGASEDVRKLYAEGYSLRRLRERSTRRSAHDRFSDLWDSVRIVFRGLARGQAKLGLPALAGLFAEHQCRDLDAAKLENRALLAAMFKLCWLRVDSGLSRVNWRDMGPEELGSVYEGLLELVPQIKQGGRSFEFATGGETKGNTRKTTGSYYTPDSLVQVLLDSALDPVVKEAIAKNPEKPVEALLQLSIVDPACGSGHFLLAAARRLAAQVARLAANGTPSAAEYRRALRQVVGRCIFGVDLNPMAVELCRVSLWMEAVEPGKPLTFLDSHIQQGNSLIGTTPELMAKGIPDAAWDPIEGDDRKIASALKKRNKAAAKGQRDMATLWSKPAREEAESVAQAVARLDAASDASVEELANKQAQWDGILRSAQFAHQKFVADAWCAAFVWPKTSEVEAAAAPTNDVWRQIRDGQGHPPALTRQTTEELVRQYSFFHWHLAFPQVFARGGFDVVLGNPPWERVKLQEKEWFAARRPELANATNAAVRKSLLRALERDDPVEYGQFCLAQREANGEAHFGRSSGRFRWGAAGDTNTFAMFAEIGLLLLAKGGRVGLLLPLGIATDDTYGRCFEQLVEDGKLVQICGFINERKLFPGVLHNFKFATFVACGERQVDSVTCVFNCFTVEESKERARQFTLTAADLRLLNPETRTCPVFFWSKSAEITKRVYRRIPTLGGDTSDLGWQPIFWTMFHMSNDSALFRRRGGPALVPLYEAKMIHQYNNRYASYGLLSNKDERAHMLPELPASTLNDPSAVAEPYYYVPQTEVSSRLKFGANLGGLIALREVTSAGLERTIIACVLPLVGANHKLIFVGLRPRDESLAFCLLACLNAIPLDFLARQKLGGASLSGYLLRQLPVPAPKAFLERASWDANLSLSEWIRPRVLELVVTSHELAGFGAALGYAGPPFRWQNERRFAIQAEVDASMFHLYGLNREDVEYILGTFPVLRQSDEKAHGEYRTKRVILEIYDAMAEAARTGKPYQTRLDPPPADPRVAHPDDRKNTGKKRSAS